MTESEKNRDEEYEEIHAELNKSLTRDRRLFYADARVNLVYCDVLFQAGILSRTESERIKSGLQTILKRADYNRNYLEESATEDVHSFVETRLVGLIGAAGEKLGIGRSREERFLTALRLWLRGEIEMISSGAKHLQTALVDAGERQRQTVLPSYADRRRAQPILWAHWCLAYFERFARDRERLDEVWRRVNILPLGAPSAAGTSIEIDREEAARALGFEGVSANSLDAISDADFAAEFLSACSILTVHTSRLSEDLITFNSAEFGFLETSDEHSLVSERQKRFDLLEIPRRNASVILGHQTALGSLMKSLPLGVHTDAREAANAVFDTVDRVKLNLKVARIVLENIRVDEAKTRDAAASEFYNAAELVDYLVQREEPIKSAQSIAAEIVSTAIAKNKKLSEMSLAEMRQFSELINKDVFDALSLEQTLASKNQIGGTAPERVFEALEAARLYLDRE